MEARVEALEARVTKVERKARRNGLRLKEALEALELARSDYQDQAQRLELERADCRAETQRLREIADILAGVRVARSTPPG